MSTARLYTLTQPGHSLWGVAEPNPFNTECVVAPKDSDKTNGKVCGGSIAFGGGLPLYRNKTRVGGLGLSGDIACADHEIAKRIRHLANLDPEKGQFADDITFTLTTPPFDAAEWLWKDLVRSRGTFRDRFMWKSYGWFVRERERVVPRAIRGAQRAV